MCSIKIMTQNIRMDAQSPLSSPDNWDRRSPVLTQLIESVLPDVLCVQEMLFHQKTAIDTALGKDYSMIGYGREGGSRGEYSAIFVNNHRFQIEQWDQFWLSDFPETIASSTWGNSCTRIAVWTLLTDVTNGSKCVVANTHTDNISEKARVLSMKLIAKRLGAASKGLPIILCGDFNDDAGHSAEFDAITSLSGLQDSWVTAQQHDSAAYGSFVDYKDPVENGERIDWILVSPQVKVLSAALYPFQLHGTWASDHIPMIATIELQS